MFSARTDSKLIELFPRQVISKMNDRSQEEEALSQAQIFANVERQINAATAAISEACKQLKQEADKLHNERETFDRMSKKIESTQISETVNLNIGGEHFTTTRQTLTKDPNSFFAAMFSGRFPLKRSEDGAILIDRDGKHFRLILNYLRDGKLSLPEEATCTDLEEIETEATYYQIQGIIDELSKPRSAQSQKSSIQGATALATSKGCFQILRF